MKGIIILDIVAIILQISAAIVGYQIYKYNRLSKGWLALIFAFIVQIIRRGFNIYYDMTSYGITSNTSMLLDRGFMLIISLSLFIGLLSMLKNFENFEVVEKEVNKVARRKK